MRPLSQVLSRLIQPSTINENKSIAKKPRPDGLTGLMSKYMPRSSVQPCQLGDHRLAPVEWQNRCSHDVNKGTATASEPSK
jgi:hypothetical protein